MQSGKKIFYSKLIHVLEVLEADQREFEYLKKSVDDQELKQILLKLIKNEQRYVNQLVTKLSEDGHPLDVESQNGKEYLGKEAKKIKFTCMEELYAHCKSKENAIVMMYLEAIDSCNFEKKLKQIMQDQLNELKVLFLKIRINYMIKSRLLNPHDLRKEHPFRRH